MFMDLLKQELGAGKSAGNQTRFDCPFCGEQKQKFYIHSEKGLWDCKKCSETGNPVSFVMKHFGVSFHEASDILATYDYDVESRSNGGMQVNYGNELSEEEQLLLFISREGQPYEEEMQLRFKCPPPPTNCKPLVENFNNPEAFIFFEYLNRRGVTLEQIQTHRISYVTLGEVTLLDDRKMSLYNHVVFFTCNEQGEVIYWNTRSIEPDPFIKSFNAPSREDEYSKRNTVFNLNIAKNSNRIVIHEGVFDALTLGEDSVATFGKKITNDQAELIVNVAKTRKIPIFIFLDKDAREEMKQTAENMRRLYYDLDIYYVVNLSDDDANDLGKEACNELINKAVYDDSEGRLMLDILFPI